MLASGYPSAVAVKRGDRSDEEADPECEYGIPPRGGEGPPGVPAPWESFLVCGLGC